MEKPVWILKNKAGDEVWSTYERDYLTVVELALKALGYELVRGDLESCRTCGLPNGACTCHGCPTCG